MESLERRRERLGLRVLKTLEREASRILPVYTPSVVMECASDTYWYGEMDEQMALDEHCGDDEEQRDQMRASMVTREMFDKTFPKWALRSRVKPLGTRTLKQVVVSTRDRPRAWQG